MNTPDHSVTILLVDDDPEIIWQLTPLLERAGFRVISAADGHAALEQVPAAHPHAVVLDVLLPGLDGRAVLRRLRQQGQWLPVLLLTQVGDSTERALALEEGADDYLNKPFDPHELIARLRALLRRAQAGQRSLAGAHRLRSGSLLLDRKAHRAWLPDGELHLTPKAFALLAYLLTHPDELLTRERLLDAVWGWDYPAGTRAVDTRIAEIRRALAAEPVLIAQIEAIPGQGYRFSGPVEVVT